MRVVVFSDIHGNGRAVEKIILKNPEVRHFIFLGDGDSIVDRVAQRRKDLTFHIVAGNCDYGSFFPNTDIFTAEAHKIIFCHGHTIGVKYGLSQLSDFARSQGADIALFGHTHCRYYEYDDGLHIINPGSASCPRDGKAPCYLFIDMTKGGIAFNHVEI